MDNGATGADAESADWTLTADGPTPVTGPGSSPQVTDQTVDAGDYDLSESGPAGYTASSWDCGDADLAGATVTLPNGGEVTCEIVNTAIAPTLTLIKVVDPGATGAIDPETAWTLTAVNGASTITGVTGTPAVTTAAAVIGTYSLSESGPAGYDTIGWVCTGGASTTATTVTLDLADSATCTITNTAQQPTLTLVKQVVNDNGGQAEATDWTLDAAGPTTPVNGVTGSAAVTGVPVQIGSYVLGESGGPTGYTADPWQCEGGTLTGATVTVALGEDVTCTIINRDDPGSYVLTKVSDPASGATVEPGDTVTYTLTVTNNSAGYVAGATVIDDLSDVLDNATIATIGAGGSLTGTTLTWTVPGPLAPGDEVMLSYTVTVDAGAYGETLRNVATPDENGECEEPNDCTTIHPTPHWVLTKSSDPDRGSTVNPGDTVTYTLTARNDSDGVVTAATVADDLSDVLDNATLGTISPADQAGVSGTTLTWTLPSPFEPGQVATLTYTVTVDADAYSEELRNVATPGAGGECVPPSEVQPEALAAAAVTGAALTAADAPEWCETEHPTPGWVLEKSSDPATGSVVDPGDQVTYALTVTNDSNGVVSNAVVTDDLSDVLQYATLDALPAGATLSGSILTWQVPTLLPGRGAQLSYTVTVDSDAYDVSFANVATPGDGGECLTCTTTHETPPDNPDNPDNPNLPDTGGTSLAPLGLGAGFLLAGALLLAESRRRRLAEVPVRTDSTG